MRYRILDDEGLRAMAPLVRRILDDLCSAYDAVLWAAGHGDGCIEAELAVVQRHVAELERLGGSVRTLEPVVSEFLCERDGAIGYATWTAGEALPSGFRALDALCTVSAASA